MGACLQVCSALIRDTCTLSVTGRCLSGILNGNIDVIKRMMAELTDETNMARGLSLILAAWAVGGLIGCGRKLTRFLSFG